MQLDASFVDTINNLAYACLSFILNEIRNEHLLAPHLTFNNDVRNIERFFYLVAIDPCRKSFLSQILPTHNISLRMSYMYTLSVLAFFCFRDIYYSKKYNKIVLITKQNGHYRSSIDETITADYCRPS
jgi:hypothetical protein